MILEQRPRGCCAGVIPPSARSRAFRAGCHCVRHRIRDWPTWDRCSRQAYAIGSVTHSAAQHWPGSRLPRKGANPEVNRILHRGSFLRDLFTRAVGGRRFFVDDLRILDKRGLIDSIPFHFHRGKDDNGVKK